MDGDTPHTPDASGSWQFKQDGQSPAPQPVAPEEEIDWTASEFVAHEKGLNWYLALTASVLFFTALVYLVTRDKITTGIIIVAAIIFGVYAKRQPRTLAYHLEATGLRIGEKFYDFNQFRSFVVLHDGAISSVSFMPLKRFMPILTVYYEPEDEQKIVQLISSRLPMENRGRDAIDRFLHRIRF